MKNEYRRKCDITDSTKKMTDLMQKYKIFKIAIINDLKTFRRSKLVFRITSKDSTQIYLRLMWGIGLLINLFLICDVRITNGILMQGEGALEAMVGILNMILIIMGAFLVFFWTMTRYEKQHQIMKEEFMVYYPYRNTQSPLWAFKLSVLDSFLFERMIASCILHIICGVLSINKLVLYNSQALRFVQNEWVFWNVGHLFTIYNISPTVRIVISAITTHYTQLLITFLMMIFFIYLFAFLIMTQFQNETWDTWAHLNCDKLYYCFFAVLNYGLRYGGGIGEVMKINSYDNAGIFFNELALQFLFFIIINILLLNIIFGIIIDTFSQLRDENDQRDDDESDVCFVCGKTRTDFNRQGKHFDHHIKIEHLPWTYIYYIYYLDHKGEDELTGLEQNCWDDFKKLKTDWLPIGKTIYLDYDNKEEELKEISNTMNIIEKKMLVNHTTVMDAVNTLSSRMEEIANRCDDLKRGIGIDNNTSVSFSKVMTQSTPISHGLNQLYHNT